MSNLKLSQLGNVPSPPMQALVELTDNEKLYVVGAGSISQSRTAMIEVTSPDPPTFPGK